MPAAQSGSPFSDGGWLANTGGYGMIYAAKGIKTGDFYSYDAIRDTMDNADAHPGRTGTLFS